MPQPHLDHQSLEALPTGGGSGGVGRVAVNHDDLVLTPAQGRGALPQSILAASALGMLEHLPQGGLADVKVSGSFQVLRGDFLFGAHKEKPRQCRVMLVKRTVASGVAFKDA